MYYMDTNLEEEKVEQVEVELIKEGDVEELLEGDSDGTLTEVYRDKRTGNIVTPPVDRWKGRDDYERRERCWNFYLDTVRKGIPNARDSARKAGFSENTAINIGNIKWFKDRKDKLRRSKMMTNAERNIARILNMGLTKIKKLDDGSEEEVFDPDRARIVADMSKLIVTTLGKDEGWSTKTELKVTALPTPIMEIESEAINIALQESNEVTE